MTSSAPCTCCTGGVEVLRRSEDLKMTSLAPCTCCAGGVEVLRRSEDLKMASSAHLHAVWEQWEFVLITYLKLQGL